MRVSYRLQMFHPFVFNLTEAWLCVAFVDIAKHTVSLLVGTPHKMQIFLGFQQKVKWLHEKLFLLFLPLFLNIFFSIYGFKLL